MALSDKKSILTKVSTNSPVFKTSTSGALTKKLSFYTPTFSTVGGVSQGAPQNLSQGVPQNVATETALSAPSNSSTAGSNTQTVTPSQFQLLIGVRVQAATSESINLFYSTNSGSSWTLFESGFQLQFVQVGSVFQRSGYPVRAHYIKPGDNLWVAACNASGSGTGSISYGSSFNIPVPNVNYTASCGLSNPGKFDNISGSSPLFITWIAIAIDASGSLIPC